MGLCYQSQMKLAVAKQLYQALIRALPLPLSVRVQFFRNLKAWPNLSRPGTFNEKIQYKKLYSDTAWLAQYADKIAVKDYVKGKLGDAWVIPTLWHGTELPPSPLWVPPFIIKANHASGWNVFVTSHKADWSSLRSSCAEWISSPWHSHLGENYYNLIPRKLLIEPVIGEDLNDYKFFVFNGVVRFIQVDTDRFFDHKRAFFDRDWKRQSFGLKYPIATSEITKPRHFEAMLAAAETLAAPFDFCRVDLYDLIEHPKFGEITFFPGAGFERFSPPSYDQKFGDLWSLT